MKGDDFLRLMMLAKAGATIGMLIDILLVLFNPFVLVTVRRYSGVWQDRLLFNVLPLWLLIMIGSTVFLPTSYLVIIKLKQRGETKYE